MFEPYGSEIVDKVRVHNEQNGGMSRFMKFPIYLDWIGEPVTQTRINELSDQFSSLALEGVINSAWIPGAENYLRINRYEQIFVLVSATPKQELDLIIKELCLDNIFYNVYGSPTGKKEGMQSTLNTLKIDKNKTVMIGDAIADLEAASACNIPFILKRNSINKKLFKNYTGYSVSDIMEL